VLAIEASSAFRGAPAGEKGQITDLKGGDSEANGVGGRRVGTKGNVKKGVRGGEAGSMEEIKEPSVSPESRGEN